jgi:hypothetical protein
MHNRMKQIANFTVVAAALTGCAGVQIPKEYAASHGYGLIDVHGKKYYCRRDQPEVPGSPMTGVECLTRAQLSARVAQLNSAPYANGGPSFDPSSLQFGISPSAIPPSSAWQWTDSSAAGRNLYNGPR